VDALRAVVIPWFVSRVVAITTLLVALPASAGSSRLRQLVTLYDGGFYFFIAEHGYGRLGIPQPRWAFFPGVPLVIRIVEQVLDPQLALFVVEQLAFLVALWGLLVLARRHGSTRSAVLAVWALALFPAAFVFSLSYPSSLFLAATIWAFVLVEDRHDLAAGVVAAGTVLLRPNGFVVVIALAVAAWSARRIVLVALPGAVALLAWCSVCLAQTGDPLAFLTAKSGWREITLVGALTGADGRGSALVHAGLAVVGIAAVVLRRTHLPRAWLVLTALYVVPSFVLGMIGLGRYTNECFPCFVALGQLLATWKPRLAGAALGLSACGLVLMSVAAARYNLVP
jgi:hypothetical protein